jgi:hypothetical protein
MGEIEEAQFILSYMNPETFKLLNELIIALSHLLWPIITLVIVCMFRQPLRGLMERLVKGKLFGQELELEPSVTQLRLSVEQAQLEVEQLPQKQGKALTDGIPITDEQKVLDIIETDSEIGKILDYSINSPELGIVRLSALLEKEAREILASTNWLKATKRISLIEAFKALEDVLPKHALSSLRVFQDLRNQIVHGHAQTDKRQTLQVLDLGITLLKALRAIPIEIHVVQHSGVDVYDDPECTKKRDGVKGLILENVSPNRAVKTRAIYPTTNWTYYREGRRVTWEWEGEDDVPAGPFTHHQAWYIDPDTGEKRVAWSYAMEFKGRHIEEVHK